MLLYYLYNLPFNKLCVTIFHDKKKQKKTKYCSVANYDKLKKNDRIVT